MILRNFYNTLAGMFITDYDASSIYSESFGDGSLIVKTTTGTTIAPKNNNNNNYFFYSLFPSACVTYATGITSNSVSTPVFRVGTGNTPVTFEDYKLDAPVNSNFQISSITKTFSYSEQSKKHTAHMNMIIESKEEVVIKEFGIERPTSTMNRCLIFREVLSVPVTLPANTPMSFKFDIDFSFPM